MEDKKVESVVSTEETFDTLRNMDNLDKDTKEALDANEAIPREAFEKFAAEYDAKGVDAFVDPATGKVVEKENLSPWQMIQAICAKLKTEIKDPAKGCRRCMGRGYIGIDSKSHTPIPCSCIFVDKKALKAAEQKGTGYKFGRAQKRRLSRLAMKSMRRLRAAVGTKTAKERKAEAHKVLLKKKAKRKIVARVRKLNRHQRKGN